VSALRAIIFGTLVMAVIIVMWAVIAVSLVHPLNKQLVEIGVYNDCERCGRAFASVTEACLTFLQTCIVGDEWGQVALPLMEEFPMTTFLFVPALLSLQIGLLNVVAAVIVDRQAQARQEDEKLQHALHQEALMGSYGRLANLFMAIDKDGNGSMSLDELLQCYRKEPELREIFELMDVSEEDLGLVFAILDKDRSGDVTFQEFVEQLHFMKTVNGHTLLVYIKHYSAMISEKLDHQGCVMSGIWRLLGMDDAASSLRPTTRNTSEWRGAIVDGASRCHTLGRWH